MNDSNGSATLLETLHEDVVQSCARIGDILDRARALGVTHGTDLGSERLRRQAESVRDLELVMPIIAPMKAGKSTLINAIIGSPLLPARANPMTTLPTRIRLVDGLDPDSPDLELTPETIKLFDRFAGQIRAKIVGATWSVPESQSHLGPLAASIADGTAERLRERYTGSAQIQSVLARLNDMARLAMLAGVGDPLSEIPDLPVLNTGHSGGSVGTVSTEGRLVVVDTPGPNEQAIAQRLGPAIEAVLRDSHVVLVILDYTQMESVAAADVKDRLAPHLGIIGTSKILAVVNKVDERKKSADLNKEDTRRAVRHSLGLSEQEAETQVFETVARWGLVGAQVLGELEQLGEGFDPTASEAAEALYKEVRPFTDWGSLSARLTVTEIREDAREVLARSGILELVGTAIARLRAGAAPNVIDSGVRRFQDALAGLSGILSLERASAERGSAELQAHLSTLDGEKRELQLHRDAMPDAEALGQRFSAELAGFVAALTKQGLAIIALLEEPKETDTGGSDFVRSLFRSTRRRMEELLNGNPNSDAQEFAALADAERFMQQLSGSIAEQLHELLDNGRHELDLRVDAIAAQVVSEQENAVAALVAGSITKLSEAFSVTLQLPPPAVIGGELVVDLAGPEVRKTQRSGSYQSTERRRNPWTLGLTFRDVPVTKAYTSTVETFIVSRGEIAGQLRNTFDAYLASLRIEIDEYVTGTLSDDLNAYYEGLDRFMQNHYDALERSLHNAELDEAQQTQRRSDLMALVKQTADEQAKLAGYLTRLDDYLGRHGYAA